MAYSFHKGKDNSLAIEEYGQAFSSALASAKQSHDG